MQIPQSRTLVRLESGVEHLTKAENIRALFRAHAELDRLYVNSRRELNEAIAELNKVHASSAAGMVVAANAELLTDYVKDIEQLSEQMDVSLPGLRRRVELRINELLPETFNVATSSDAALAAEPDYRETVITTADGLAGAAALALLIPGGVFASAFLGGAAVGMYGSVVLHDIIIRHAN
jgi:hypothetical protein